MSQFKAKLQKLFTDTYNIEESTINREKDFTLKLNTLSPSQKNHPSNISYMNSHSTTLNTNSNLSQSKSSSTNQIYNFTHNNIISTNTSKYSTINTRNQPSMKKSSSMKKLLELHNQFISETKSNLNKVNITLEESSYLHKKSSNYSPKYFGVKKNYNNLIRSSSFNKISSSQNNSNFNFNNLGNKKFDKFDKFKDSSTSLKRTNSKLMRQIHNLNNEIGVDVDKNMTNKVNYNNKLKDFLDWGNGKGFTNTFLCDNRRMNRNGKNGYNGLGEKGCINLSSFLLGKSGINNNNNISNFGNMCGDVSYSNAFSNTSKDVSDIFNTISSDFRKIK